MNPATLGSTVVAGFQNVSSILSAPNYATLSESNNRYTFYMIDTNNDRRLYTVDLGNGAVISNPLFPAGLAPQENVIELRYHRGNGTLYGLHWGAPFTAAGLESKGAGIFALYPNPFSQTTTLFLDKPYANAELILTNITGQIIRKENHSGVSSISLAKAGLAPGVYFVTLITEAGTATRKIIAD
jgi:hypothetical protein